MFVCSFKCTIKTRGLKRAMDLDSVVAAVEEPDAADVAQDGVCRVVQHVVSGHWRESVSLRDEHERKKLVIDVSTDP